MIDNEQDWLERVRRDLQQDSAELDPGIRSRLAGIRRQALARPRARRYSAWLPPIAAAAAACLVLAAVLTLRQPEAPQQDMLDDMDLITTSESLELFEDLEFYEWLEAYDLPG
jgi:hypothetical protein